MATVNVSKIQDKLYYDILEFYRAAQGLTRAQFIEKQCQLAGSTMLCKFEEYECESEKIDELAEFNMSDLPEKMAKELANLAPIDF